jgi:hypothetical protein
MSAHLTSRSSLPAAGWQAAERTSLRTLVLTCLIGSSGALAQSTSPIAPASSGMSAGCAGAATSDAGSADVDQFRCLTADEQAASLRIRMENHTLSSLSDNQILALMDAMKPEAFVAYARSDMVRDGSYEYRMFRQELVLGRWLNRPDSTQYGCRTATIRDKRFFTTKRRTRIPSSAIWAARCISRRGRSPSMARSRTPFTEAPLKNECLMVELPVIWKTTYVRSVMKTRFRSIGPRIAV